MDIEKVLNLNGFKSIKFILLAIALFITGSICVYVYQPDVFMSIDIWRLLILSASITTPTFVIIFVSVLYFVVVYVEPGRKIDLIEVAINSTSVSTAVMISFQVILLNKQNMSYLQFQKNALIMALIVATGFAGIALLINNRNYKKCISWFKKFNLGSKFFKKKVRSS